MKRILIIFMLIFLSTNLFSHLRFIGPDPYFSFTTFPQDFLKFKYKTIFITNFTNKGWMGNLDNPNLSPSPNYVSTSESIEESVYGNRYKAEFNGKWFYSDFISLPYIFKFGKLKISPVISGRLDVFNLNSSGNAIGEEEGITEIVPFNAKVSQTNSTITAGFIAAKQYRNFTLSWMLTYKKFNESTPSGYLNYTLNGIEHNLNLFTWGWSTTSSCSHIFGISTNIDAFKQDYYSDTDYNAIDFVTGININNHRAGIRIRNISGKNINYSYNKESNQYTRKKYGNLINKTTIRVYDVFKLKKMRSGDLYVVFLIEGDFTKNNFTKNGLKLESAYNEKAFGGEVLPFLHFPLNRKGFIRIGTSLSVFFGNFEYNDIWGGQKTILPGWYYIGKDVWWQRPSYGNFLKITNFSEIDTEISLSNKTTLLLHFWTHLTYTHTKKIYGDVEYNEENGYTFIKEAERKNTLKEFWLGGLFGIRIKGKPEIMILLNLPIQYDTSSTTTINEIENDY